MPKSKTKPIKLDIALQGGGAHGAFTWGVLERLLDDERIEPLSFSGASAGAMNAVVAASGLATGGRKHAQHQLWSFWKGVNRTARRLNPALDVMEAFPGMVSASKAWWTLMSGGNVSFNLSPETGKPALNGLRDLIVEHVDFEALRSPEAPRLFISATDVSTGAARIFRNDDLSADAVLASACLPLAFPPVTIDGREYWDGGYSSNPPLIPLVAESPSDDLLLVTINPRQRTETPRKHDEISDRISEITFNLGLIKEVRGLVTLQDALSEGAVPRKASDVIQAINRLRIHEIHDQETFLEIPTKSKMLPGWRLLTKLHGVGQRITSTWLEDHFDDLGKRSSARLQERYME